MNYTDLSERLLKVADWSINAVGIRRIEKGERRVTPDDLTALARALEVSTATLLMPDFDTASPDDAVSLTGIETSISASQAWAWLTARDLWEPGYEDALRAFYLRAWPRWTREEVNQRFRAAMQKLREDVERDMFKHMDWQHGDD